MKKGCPTCQFFLSWCAVDCDKSFSGWVGSRYSCANFLLSSSGPEKCSVTGELCMTRTETCPYELNTKG